MIIGCFRGCFSFNAESSFDKHKSYQNIFDYSIIQARLQATYSGDYEPPTESDIQQILLTLAGNDPETRPDVAFQLIQSKMQYSESRNQWNYLVKNLILLDRCVEDRSFVNDIATIHILHVENYKDPDPKNNIIKIDGFIRKYFQYIKMKSRLYAKKNSSFNVSKNEKKKYFQSLSTEKVFVEMNEAVALFQFIIELVKTNTDPLKRISKRGYLEYKLNQYVFHLMLYTMMNLYTTMFTVIAINLERLTECNYDDSIKIKNYYIQFLKNNELFSQFVEDHKFIKGYEEIKVSDFYQPNRNAMNVINDWIALLEKRKNMVNPDAVIIKLDKDALQTQLVIDKVTKYPIKTDNKVNFLGEDENCIYIKQVTSELKDGFVSNPNDSFEAGYAFRLDKQDSNITTTYYNNEDLEKLSDDQHRGFQFGKIAKHQIKVLENANTGFSKDFFSVFKNEYSSQFNKNSKYVTQQLYNNKFEKCNLLEDYFTKSFQNTVSFMINERFTTTIDASIKELPTFEVNIFNAFKNEYSVVTPMHYTFDDSKIKYLPNQVKQKEQASALNVKDVYTIQGIDTDQASEFMANLITKNEKSPQKPNQSPQKSNQSPQKSNQSPQKSNQSPQKPNHSPEKAKKGKNNKQFDSSPKQEQQQTAYNPQPQTNHFNNGYQDENQYLNNDYDLKQNHENSETKNMYEREVHRTDQLDDNNYYNESTNITNSNKYDMDKSNNFANINNSDNFDNNNSRNQNDTYNNNSNNENNNTNTYDNYNNSYSNDNNNDNNNNY